jgi:hypothetical protein
MLNDDHAAMGAEAVLFHEVQPLSTSNEGWLLVLLAAGMVIGFALLRGESPWAGIALGGLTGGLLRCWQKAGAGCSVQTTLTGAGLRVVTEPQGPGRVIAVAAIEDCWARDVAPEERVTLRRDNGAVYAARPDRGVEILLSNGETLVVSTRFPELLAGLILARRAQVERSREENRAGRGRPSLSHAAAATARFGEGRDGHRLEGKGVCHG